MCQQNGGVNGSQVWPSGVKPSSAVAHSTPVPLGLQKPQCLACPGLRPPEESSSEDPLTGPPGLWFRDVSSLYQDPPQVTSLISLPRSQALKASLSSPEFASGSSLGLGGAQLGPDGKRPLAQAPSSPPPRTDWGLQPLLNEGVLRAFPSAQQLSHRRGSAPPPPGDTWQCRRHFSLS